MELNPAREKEGKYSFLKWFVVALLSLACYFAPFRPSIALVTYSLPFLPQNGIRTCRSLPPSQQVMQHQRAAGGR